MEAMPLQMHPARHFPALAFTAALHILIIYALLTGLSHHVAAVIYGPLQTKLIEELKPPPPDAPPPPPPKFAPPRRAFIPPPDVNIAHPVSPTAITAVSHVAPPPEPKPVPAPPPQVVRRAPVIDAAHSCTKPEYPAASRRLEETGTVLLKFLIDVNGRALESKVESSSGFDRLDEAARSALGNCRFKPGTVDGRPEQSWAHLKYTWKLN